MCAAETSGGKSTQAVGSIRDAKQSTKPRLQVTCAIFMMTLDNTVDLVMVAWLSV